MKGTAKYGKGKSLQTAHKKRKKGTAEIPRTGIMKGTAKYGNRCERPKRKERKGTAESLHKIMKGTATYGKRKSLQTA
jgi:hypothetical protein